MRKEMINETFSLRIPDQFETLGPEELQAMYRKGDPFRWGVRDRNNHLLIVALWKRYPVFLSWLLDLKSVVKKNEELTRSGHESSGYRLLGFVSLKTGSETLEGYRFCARNEAGEAQVCSSFLARDGRTVYSFMCVGREENMDACLPVIDRIMETLEYE